jgi:4'-phosphopantetheinyl transferase EntD
VTEGVTASGRTVLGRLLPPGVESEECFGEPPDGALFPEESAVVAGAVELRRREYATVRSCARACLRRLGYPPAPILPGFGGAPGWPQGAVGSLTHCAGYAAAAVASEHSVASIGIDAEPDAPLPPGVLDLVATRSERRRLADHGPVIDGVHADRLLFSAKEAVYKAWFPRTGRWLDPSEAEVLVARGQGTFRVVLLRDDLHLEGRRVTRLEGRWVRAHGILLTAVTLQVPQAR